MAMFRCKITSVLVAMVLLIRTCHSCNPARFFTRFLEEDSTLTVLIGGTREFNQTSVVGSSLVELMGVNGSCRRHRITLPYSLCNHRAVFLPLQERILVCGGFHNDTCKVSRQDSSRKCLVWLKGDFAFTELKSRSSTLPPHEGGADFEGHDTHSSVNKENEMEKDRVPESQRQQARFDFQHVLPNIIYYRQWGSTKFWKGFVDRDNQLVWTTREDAPFPTRRGCSLVYQGRFVMIGGEFTDKSDRVVQTKMMMRYLEDEGGREIGWQMIGTLPKPLVDIECLEYNEGIVVVGGKTGKKDGYNAEMAKTVRYWNEWSGQWDNESKIELMTETRTHPALSIMRDKRGVEHIIAFGGYDDIHSTRFPRYLMTAERYSPVLRAWEWPEFGIDEPKSDIAVVTMPASWIPECQDDHFAKASRHLIIPHFLMSTYALLFIV